MDRVGICPRDPFAHPCISRSINPISKKGGGGKGYDSFFKKHFPVKLKKLSTKITLILNMGGKSTSNANLGHFKKQTKTMY